MLSDGDDAVSAMEYETGRHVWAEQESGSCSSENEETRLRDTSQNPVQLQNQRGKLQLGLYCPR